MSNHGKIKALCRTCKIETNHVILQQYDQSGADEEHEFHWCDIYQIIQCAGCETTAFRRSYSDSTNYYPMTDNYGEEISVFPNPLPLKEPIDDNHLIPGLIGSVYLETLAAYNSKSYILCAMGLRSIIEAICIDRKCKMERNLKLSIEKLRNSGNISELQVDILQNCKDFLNITFHEIKKPSRAEITAAFGAIESILASVYIHPETGEYLRKRHQRRKGSPIS